MKTILFRLSLRFLMLCLMSIGGSVVADEAKTPAWSIGDLKWMAGFWHGDALGGYCEEVWTEPVGGTMIAVFRMVVEDKTRVLEFLVIEQTEAGIIFRLKHYNSAMEPWEEDPFVFHLVSLEGSRAVFEAPKKVADSPRRMVYHLRDDGKLSARVEGWEDKDAEALELILDKKNGSGAGAGKTEGP